MTTPFSIATVDAGAGPTTAIVQGDELRLLPGGRQMHELIVAPDGLLSLADDIAQGRLGDPISADSVRLLPPVPAPPNLYMIGANYADHSREMGGLAPDDPIEKPSEGPYVFLKPTSTLVGHRDQVVLPSIYRSVDWEVELAVVIGRRAHKVAEGSALAYVAGYTVANDISVRDAFWRGEDVEPALRCDWFAQKGWVSSCPAGPWLLPAEFCPRPGELDLRLTVNGEVQQESSTREMIFSIEEIIAYISRVVPLVPGDMICTGTCAGVGAGRGRFLSPGDVVVAEVEGIGALVNEAVAEEIEAPDMTPVAAG
jgi:2-keto-4-pentenoate hydratase/2-oxohepta-3-ene-1,7-dioic acid hydratase in catechol pathway